MKKSCTRGICRLRRQRVNFRELFGQAGSVETVRIITDRDTGRSNSFHFQSLPLGQSASNVLTLPKLQRNDLLKSVFLFRTNQRNYTLAKSNDTGMARDVEVTSDGDMAAFTSSGFVPASTTKLSPSPLPLPVIRIQELLGDQAFKHAKRFLLNNRVHLTSFIPFAFVK